MYLSVELHVLQHILSRNAKIPLTRNAMVKAQESLASGSVRVHRHAWVKRLYTHNMPLRVVCHTCLVDRTCEDLPAIWAPALRQHSLTMSIGCELRRRTGFKSVQYWVQQANTGKQSKAKRKTKISAKAPSPLSRLLPPHFPQ
jgi:hypothetical protein